MSPEVCVVLAQLVAKSVEPGGYITYVFLITEQPVIDKLKTKYIMCTQFPNWDHKEIQLGEEGYLQYQEIIAGKDQWYNGKGMVYYRYNMIQFLKFVPKPTSKEFKYKL